MGIAALVLGALVTGAAQDNPGAAFAASDGKGQVQLLWFPPASQWPAGGWRITDTTGRAVVQQVTMGDANALAELPIEDADTIRHLPQVLNKPAANERQKHNFISLLGLRAFSDPKFARALGLSATLTNVSRGSRAYTIQGLDAAGTPNSVRLTTVAVDGAVATPLPPAPDGVEAKLSEQGVSLNWNPPAENRTLPTITCEVERNGSSISVKPFVVGTKWNPKVALVVDRSAPPNQMATYRIYTVDVFGRRSQPASIRIFYPDFRALAPPVNVTASASSGKVAVSWTAEKKPNLVGYLVERALMPNGPWETLTTQALPPDTARFEDDNTRGGTQYYYHVRAVGPRGDLGPPSFSASATPTNAGTPPAPSGLAADAGQTRVRLTWNAVPFPVAGYFVERRTASGSLASGNWVRLNARVTPEPLYDDYIGSASAVTFEYRVHAVALDNAEGPPSAGVRITLTDRSVPGPPAITDISGAGGKVALTFAPAVPEERTSQFLVLRSGNAKDLGLVMGDPLPGSARNFDDLYVSPGETYFYRLVAVDATGDRSDATDPVTVRVGYPDIPRPASPMLKRGVPIASQVTLQFAKGPAGLSVVVERQAGPASGWIRVAGPLDGISAVDEPPAGKISVRYRISYVTASGRVGDPSEPVSLQ